jgi:hypothetical protein
MEARENRRELEHVMDAAIDAVMQESDQQHVAESPALEKKRGQERE